MATPDPMRFDPTGPRGGSFSLRDPLVRGTLIGAGLLFFLAGAGWALYGDSIFLQTLAAGIANCF
jgi:hypothetical protein